MNICIVSPRYPYKDNMEFVFVKKLVDEWAKLGHKCVVVTPFSLTTYLRKRISYKPIYYRDVIQPGIYVDVYNPRVISIPKLGINGVSLNNWIADKVVYEQISSLKESFDFLYCHFFSSAFVAFRYAKTNNIPVFVATGESVVDKLAKPYKSFSIKDFRNFIKGVVSVSSKNVTESLNLGYVDLNKCKVFPNGTDLNLFKKLNKDACRSKLGFPKDAFLVVCVGYFSERKGQERVLEAINKLKNNNIKVVFIGKQISSENVVLEGKNIVFKGSIPNVDLPYYLNAADIFCLPTQNEGCCNAIIEAMACGLPIISSDKSFNHDILNVDNAILLNPNNVDEISNAIKILYNEKKYSESIAANAYRDVKVLSIDERAKNILTFITEKIQ